MPIKGTGNALWADRKWGVWRTAPGSHGGQQGAPRAAERCWGRGHEGTEGKFSFT